MTYNELTETLNENVTSFSAEIANGQATIKWTNPDAIDYAKLSEILVGNVTNFSATIANTQITIKWTDPNDIIYNGKTIAWAGTKILRKVGSYPTDETDGTVVVDSKVRNQYSTTGFVDTGLTNGTTYYYQAFPYTIVYNQNEVNRVKATLTDAFITTWNMTAGGFTLPTQDGTYNATIDWGDGTTPTNHTTGNPTHTYAKAGTYQISITGQYNGFYINNDTTQRDKLISVNNWGNVGFTNFKSAFYNCVNLANLPDGAITGVEHVTNFVCCFATCQALTSIPNGLFDNCINATDFNSCFGNCQALTSIPNGLFDNCINAIILSGSFSHCQALTSIPSGLFDNCINATGFVYCFSGCTSLLTIPNELFINNVKVTNFTECFSNCRNLQLPNTIFNSTALKNKTLDMRCCFAVLSADLSPTGTAQDIWNYIRITASDCDCFKNCTALTNYANIPLTWK